MSLPQQSTPAAAKHTLDSHQKRNQRFPGSRHHNEDADAPRMAEISCTCCRDRNSKTGKKKYQHSEPDCVFLWCGMSSSTELLALLIKIAFWEQRLLAWPLSFLRTRITRECSDSTSKKKVRIVGELAKWEYRLMAFPLRMKKQSEEGGLI